MGSCRNGPKKRIRRKDLRIDWSCIRMRCRIDKKYNECRFFVPGTSECINKDRCSMQEEAQYKAVQQKEKWYKKYYTSGGRFL